MSDEERYLAAVTVVALAVYVLLLAEWVLRRRNDEEVARRSLLLTDLAVTALAVAAVTRNTFGAPSSAVWLSLAWTVVAACAIARLTSLKRKPKP